MDRPETPSLIAVVTSGNVQIGRISRDRNILLRSRWGYWAEDMIFDTPLNDADRQTVENNTMNAFAIGV